MQTFKRTIIEAGTASPSRAHLPVFIGFVLFNLQFSVYSVVDNCLNFCPFFLSFDYCIVCPLIKYFWLSLWYLHTFVKVLWSFSDDQCKIRMPKALREIVVLIFASTLMNMQKWWQRSDKSSDILARNHQGENMRRCLIF